MHPLHEYIKKRLGDRLAAKKIVVWYDPKRELAPFVNELRGGMRVGSSPAAIHIGQMQAWLAEYDGSMFEVRAAVEPHVAADQPDHVLVYVGGCEHDRRGSVLMELEKAGECATPELEKYARAVLKARYTDGRIDEILARPGVTYDDLARASSDKGSGEPPSVLLPIFRDVAMADGLLAAWLASEQHDAAIQAKGGVAELGQLIRSRLGLELDSAASLGKQRALTLRYVLGGEFRSDLRCAPPSSLDSVPLPPGEDHLTAIRELARRLRDKHSDVYADLAEQVEVALGLTTAKLPAADLGAIDTFRFEERTLLRHCFELIQAHKFDGALAVVTERQDSYWLDRDVQRKTQWRTCQAMAELGSVAQTIRALVARAPSDANAWIDAYTARDGGWYRLDLAQRRLEALRVALDEDTDERALAVVRQCYDDTCRAMADGFTRALERAHWTVTGRLHQTRIFSEVVAPQPKPVAYFLVDAMRFEMGIELEERLPKNAEVSVRHAVCALPSITPVGMAALQPGASASFNLAAHGSEVAGEIDGVVLPDLPARKKHAASRIPKLVDIVLDELLSLPASKLAKKLDGAQVVMVRSQEIDHAGEGSRPYQARQVMDTVIDNLARAIRKLSAAGVEHAVISADHGHLFLPEDRDDSMKVEAPGGAEGSLHRRCWVGRGGATPTGSVRVSAAALGYASDLDLVFPAGAGVFKAGGNLDFHHGGASLQELVIPVLTVRMKSRPSGRPTAGPVSVTNLPGEVTNRIFSITVELKGPPMSLFESTMLVRPLLVSQGRQVGITGVAVGARLEDGCVRLPANKLVTIGFLLGDDSAKTLRIVVQDPDTDAELYRSPADIPVRLST